MTCNRIVIISDSPDMRASLGTLVARAGLDAEVVNSLEAWLPTANLECAHCLVLDTAVGDLQHPVRVVMFREACAIHAVIVLTHSGDIPTAVQAIRQGAADVIQKPVNQSEFLERVSRIMATVP